MARVVVGSTALHWWFGNEAPRQPKDSDWIASTDSVIPRDGADVFSHPSLDSWVNPWVNRQGDVTRVATIDELYTIKVSHSYWELKNGSWAKHIYDLRWLKRKGAHLDLLLHDRLYKVWEEVHGKKRSNLSMEKGEFFKDAVVRTFDHDSIHESVAYGDTAMYNRVLKEGSTVDIDNRKLWSLGYDNLVLLFREEVYATALERILIPANYRGSPGQAYWWALRRTITSLTKGKSARFIVDNFESFADPGNYLERHLKNLDRLIRL